MEPVLAHWKIPKYYDQNCNIVSSKINMLINNNLLDDAVL